MKKNYLILGATSGLGLEYVQKKIKKNYIYCIGQNFTELEKSIRKIKKQNSYKKIKVNLALSTAYNVYKQIKKKLDVVIIFSGRHKHNMIKYFDENEFQEILNINLINPAKIVTKLYSENKINKKANIIFISSLQGDKIFIPGSLSYCVSKAALTTLSKSLASEMANDQIKVNSISPGMIKTPLIDKASHLSKEAIKKDKKKYLLGKDYLSKESIIHVIDFLISNKQKNITGQNIIIDSGFSLFK
jgi:NAD(P)-dependent dehydrogenase (short-subunit alcohol dehydrogenase family)